MHSRLHVPFRPMLALVLMAVLILACGETTLPAQLAPIPLAPTPLGAPPQVQTGTVLFQDDFQDGQPQEWGISSAWIVEQDGSVYTFGAPGKGGAWVKSGGGWKEYTFQADAYVESGSLVMNIHQSKQGRYSLRLGTDGVYLLKEQPSGNYTVIGEAGPISAAAWHRVSLASLSGRIQVWIDQALWFDLTDAAPLVTQGTIGVSAKDGSRVSVDNVLVTQNQEALPSGTVQAPAPLNNAPSAAEVVEEQSSEEAPTTGGQPDLVVSEVNFDPTPVLMGQPFTSNYLIENVGSGDSGPFTFLLHFHASAGIADCDMAVDNVAPGLPAWGGCVRTIDGDHGGNYPVEATVDIDNQVAESNEANNQSTVTLAAQLYTLFGGDGSQGGGQADLVVTSVTFDPAQPVKGNQFTASFGIKNQGDAASGPFTFRLKFHDAAGVADCNWDGQLGAGEIAWGGCVRQIDGNVGNYPVKATIDVESEIAESNEGNNITETTLTLIGN